MTNDQMSTEEWKADFNSSYTQPDPRTYFRALMPLNYQIPQLALPTFESVLAVRAQATQPLTTLDLCCSYGINAALLRCDVDLDELGERYLDPTMETLSFAELLAADREFYRRRRRHPDRPVLGLDASAPAIDYGVRAGALSGGWAEDLESDDPSPELVVGLRDVGLLISTGGVGYIGPRTFERLLTAMRDPDQLWLVVFVLRVFGYDEIAETLAGHGLVTEQVPGLSVRQRRFVDSEEAQSACQRVIARGLDPAGKEADGWYYADCFISRPRAEVARRPLRELLGADG